MPREYRAFVKDVLEAIEIDLRGLPEDDVPVPESCCFAEYIVVK
jgi:hypothetical protein